MAVCRICQQENHSDARFCSRCGTLLGNSTATGVLPAQSILHGHYLIQDCIGRGGMGAVYKARDLLLEGRVVAIKEMSQDGLSGQSLQEAIAAFSREATMLAQLKHPCLPHVYAQFEASGRRYLVMEFIEGETLEHVLENCLCQGTRLPVVQALSIAQQLCDVLHYLHTRHPPIIFRDLKPANIMLQRSQQLYLIDFGIARLFKPNQLKDTVALGSPGYAPPEQYRHSTSPCSDIYSLGATLHYMLTGDDPAQNLFHFQPFNIQMPALERLVMRMVSLDEKQRPTMDAVAKGLDEALVHLQHPAPSKELAVQQPDASSPGRSTPTRLSVVLATDEQDRELWRALKGHLLSLIEAFPPIVVQECWCEGTQVEQGQLDAVDRANLVLLCLSEDFLATPACVSITNRALDVHEKKKIPVLPILLRTGGVASGRLSRLKPLSEGSLVHRSLYAQEQKMVDVAKAIRKQLAVQLMAQSHAGQITLHQWLLWLLYGGGSLTCPYFVTGQYALKYIRPLGLASVLIHLLDIQANRKMQEYILGSRATADLFSLLNIVAPAATNLAEVQGIAAREKPLERSVR